MLDHIAEFTIAILELMQAELREARKGLMRLGFSIGLVVSAALLITAGLIAILWAICGWFMTIMGQQTAFLLTGLCSMAVAALLLLVAFKYGKQ